MSESAPHGAAVLTPDICVIGGGAGGLSVAAAAAAFGAPVVLIEKETLGGDRYAGGGSAIAALAVEAATDAPDFARMKTRLRTSFAALDANDSRARFEAMGVRVLRAAARFVDARTVQAGETLIRARRFVIATGSTPAIPAIQGLNGTPFLTTRTLFDLALPPQRLLIAGGDPSAVEIAQALVRFGSQVTLVTPDASVIGFDIELTGLLRERFARDGVVWRASCAIRSVVADASGVTMIAMSEGADIQCEGDLLLLAMARAPAIDNLALDQAGVRFSSDGVIVDAGRRTSNRRIYAIGDCTADAMRSTAADAVSVVKSALFRAPAGAKATHIPRVLFTDPEIACCGLSEDEARASRGDVATYRFPLAENERARLSRSGGHIKIVATLKGEILGAAVFGKGAGEMIHLWALAIIARARVSDIASLGASPLALAEASQRAAQLSLAPLTRNRWLRSAASWLRKLG